MRSPVWNEEEYPSCCAIKIYHCFEELYFEDCLDKKPLTNDEWFDSIADTGIGAIVTFANSSKGNRGVFTPTKFAKWLRKQGETVISTRPTINRGSGSKITGYFWCPTKKFQKKLSNYNKKKNDIEDAAWNDRCPGASSL